MTHRVLGKTGCRVFPLGMGCMRLPVQGEGMSPVDEELSRKVIHAAIDQGVNYLDTAPVYHDGTAEQVLGRVMGDRRDEVYLATKMSRGAVSSRQDCRELVDEQLRRLRTDRIDMYLLHNVKPDSWEDFQRFGALDAIERARDQGKVVHVGFSSHADTPFFRELLDMHDWDFCQIQFNYLDNNIQAGEEGLKEAHSRGLGVIIMEPLKGGFLARQDLFYRQKLHEERPDWSPAEWGLRWIWDRPEVHLVLSGMNSLDQVTENCRIARDALPGGFDPAHRRLLSDVKEEVSKRLKAPCSGCGYCMPCPQGVNIPRMLTLYNEVYLQGDATWSKVMYNMCTEEGALSKHCTACGRCEGLCPQGLPISKLMEEAHGLLFQAADQ